VNLKSASKNKHRKKKLRKFRKSTKTVNTQLFRPTKDTIKSKSNHIKDSKKLRKFINNGEEDESNLLIY